jgi:hypothetical protein
MSDACVQGAEKLWEQLETGWRVELAAAAAVRGSSEAADAGLTGTAAWFAAERGFRDDGSFGIGATWALEETEVGSAKFNNDVSAGARIAWDPRGFELSAAAAFAGTSAEASDDPVFAGRFGSSVSLELTKQVDVGIGYTGEATGGEFDSTGMFTLGIGGADAFALPIPLTD